MNNSHRKKSHHNKRSNSTHVTNLLRGKRLNDNGWLWRPHCTFKYIVINWVLKIWTVIVKSLPLLLPKNKNTDLGLRSGSSKWSSSMAMMAQVLQWCSHAWSSLEAWNVPIPTTVLPLWVSCPSSSHFYNQPRAFAANQGKVCWGLQLPETQVFRVRRPMHFLHILKTFIYTF